MVGQQQSTLPVLAEQTFSLSGYAFIFTYVAAFGITNRAPIGYVNVGVRDERGRENRTVQVDEDRAPHITWAFQVYASGRWTLSQIHRELIARGLTTLPTPKRP